MREKGKGGKTGRQQKGLGGGMLTGRAKRNGGEGEDVYRVANYLTGCCSSYTSIRGNIYALGLSWPWYCVQSPATHAQGTGCIAR